MAQLFKERRSSKVLMALVLLSSLVACSGKKDIKHEDPLLSAAEAIPAKDSNDASANVFADIEAAPQDSATSAGVEAPAPQQAAAPEKSPFYNTVGGESLGRVAYTLYGSRKYTPRLLNQNPDLKGAKNLSQGRKIYFDFNSLNPQPMYLTKDLLENYASELAQHIEEAPSAQQKETVKLEPGQTLQALSQKLYGTTRYWTEIYLLNHDKLSRGYDKVAAGTELSVIKRDAVVASVGSKNRRPKASPAIPAAPVEEDQMKVEDAAMDPVAPAVKEQVAATAPVMPTAPVVTQAVVPTPAPTPIAAVAPKIVEPVNNSPLPQMNTQVDKKAVPATVAAPSSSDDLFNSTNMRRAIYITLILGIALAAFYVTRPSKRSGFDMLDVTTQEGMPPAKRPRLADRDDTNQNVG